MGKKFAIVGVMLLGLSGNALAAETSLTTPVEAAAIEAQDVRSFLVMDLKEELIEAIKDQGVDGDITIENAMASAPGGQPVSINRMDRFQISAPLYIERIDVKPQSFRFEAVLKTQDSALPATIDANTGEQVADGVQEITIRGRFDEIAEVPVLNKNIVAGDVIEAKDIDWQKVSKKRLRGAMAVNETDIVGKTPKRMLRQGMPVRLSDVESEHLVEKGKVVTMYYRTPTMELKTTGIAMASGSEGELVKVKNAKSETIVQGQVTGLGEIVINQHEAAAKFAAVR